MCRRASWHGSAGSSALPSAWHPRSIPGGAGHHSARRHCPKGCVRKAGLPSRNTGALSWDFRSVFSTCGCLPSSFPSGICQDVSMCVRTSIIGKKKKRLISTDLLQMWFRNSSICRNVLLSLVLLNHRSQDMDNWRPIPLQLFLARA